ncbi:TPA: band 7 protein [candidate division WOR-3 bacterium]|jgi:regulator of protease activity HflC (stomatin/prohibitin superfamily)|uniref:Band 7 protein n=1 Tax=candidate division WOR-3 bacterium TaxID=2052148 RepID=A0A350H8E9_UNCW3|nr:band 7 protein [candidate division WOR-3 bacterium]
MGFLIVIIIIALLVLVPRYYPKFAMNKKMMVTWGAVIIAVLLLASTVRIVQPGSVGVQVLFGRVYKKVLSNGLHFVFPFVEIKTMNVRTQDYTMSVAQEEGVRKGDDGITSLTKDGLQINLDITVWYQLKSDKAAEVYQNIGQDYVEKIVRPAIRTAIRNATVLYNVTEIYSLKREELTNVIFEELDNNFSAKGIICDKVLLRNIDLPQKVKNAIDEKIAAEQDAQKMVYVLEKEQREKERKLIEAEGIAVSQKKISESLNKQYLQWYYIQNLKEVLNSNNTKVVIMPFDQNLTPLLNVGQ